MLIFNDLNLAYLAVPKTATQAIQQALEPYASARPTPPPNHTTFPAFDTYLRPRLEAKGFGPFLTVAVVRDPVDRLKSWYKYRQRRTLRGKPTSTDGMSFDAFLQARLQPDPPRFAQIGRQDRFVHWQDGQAGVDYLFDYARLDLVAAFFSDRIGVEVTFDRVNLSSRGKPMPEPEVTKETLIALRAELAAEYALYDAVSAAGCLKSDRARLTEAVPA